MIAHGLQRLLPLALVRQWMSATFWAVVAVPAAVFIIGTALTHVD